MLDEDMGIMTNGHITNVNLYVHIFYFGNCMSVYGTIHVSQMYQDYGQLPLRPPINYVRT